MAELTESPRLTAASPCCAPKQQAKCCAPAEKAGCCQPESSRCGCRAGSAIDRSRR